MAKKLWGGRFKKRTDPLVEEFTKSIDYDKKLAFYDVVGSIIHVKILKESGFLTEAEAKGLQEELKKIYNDIKQGRFKHNKRSEDIHTDIQNKLERKVGNLVLKLHTARSRNDQVLFDLKFFCKFELSELKKLCKKLQIALAESCDELRGIVIPGYTHLQHAQLVYLSDYLGSYVEMLKRDVDRLNNTIQRIKLTLGAGAFAGTPINSKVYYESLKDYFKNHPEFKELFDVESIEAVSNSLDAVSDRDFVIESLSALAILGMHLSRLAEDLIIWSTKEFNFIEIDDAFTTGSSLMPQKKNPDVLELIRGYTGTLYGNLMSVLTMMKGLPLTYNRDMQLDKPPLFSSFEIVEKELKVLPRLIRTLIWKEDIIKKKIEEDETLYATDLVYYLIKKGEPFKKAHNIIGRLVRDSIEKGRKIRDMTDRELKVFSDKLKHSKILELMDPLKSVESRRSIDRKRSELERILRANNKD